ncbi:DUF2889 domain-containing protein [Pseudoteredinibacter isoporae]|uniref:DUF2889 domain-containing protein n=1 Tax=Pseudoteredinibacter isoporae TaxID=570281 RepID=UPI00310B7561
MTNRTLSHTRNIQVQAYERDDGLWDIEAHLTDKKHFELGTPDRALIATDEYLHDMSLRISIDLDMNIREVDAGMVDTPYRRCPEVLASYQRLLGVVIGPGWQREIKQRLGGVEGCTHLRELLGPMATVAYQAVTDAVYRPVDYRQNPQVFKPLIDSCYGLSQSGDVIPRLWPEFIEQN